MSSEQHEEENSAIQALVSHWKRYEPAASGPYIHQDDAPFIPERRRSPIRECSAEAYLKERKLGRVHAALHPVPYLGNLETADLFLFMINPSVTYGDYGTQASESFQKELAAQIRQERDLCLALDPKFSWTSWFAYYDRLLGPAVRALMVSRKRSRHDVLTSVASRLAILELVPYFSEKTDTAEDIADRLPSSKLARAAALEIAERARNRKATVIVRWNYEEKTERRWRLGALSSYGNYVVASVTRSGFSKETQKAIMNRLKKPYNK